MDIFRAGISVVICFGLGTGCKSRSPEETTDAKISLKQNNVQSSQTRPPVRDNGKIGHSAKGKQSALQVSQKSVGGKAKPVPTMSAPQVMGIDVLRALNADPRMAGHRISVGTVLGMVRLNGSVPQASQRRLAEQIARRKAPKAEVVNELTIGGPTPVPVVTANSKNEPLQSGGVMEQRGKR